MPTNYVPLAFILTVSAVRAAYEDYARHQADAQEGGKQYLVYDGRRRQFVPKTSAEIVVGDIVQMVGGQAAEEAAAQANADADADRLDHRPSDSHRYAKERHGHGLGRRAVTFSPSFPADMLFLASSHESGHCFVETSSLDGESNLKIKSALPATQSLLWSAPRADAAGGSGSSGVMSGHGLRQLDLSLDVEGPNAKFESFKGVVHLNPHGGASGPNSAQQLPLKADHLLLRGTELRNTPSLLGLVVYTGVDSKIRRNVSSSAARIGAKKSGIMVRVNTLLLVMLGVQLALCFLGAVLCFSWTDRYFDRAWYLHFTQSAGLAALRSLFTWFIILSQVVPISLLVSNELVKGAQAKFIAWSLQNEDGAGRRHRW